VQVWSKSVALPGNRGSGALAYAYDWVGNRLNPPSGANPMVYNAADQLTQWPGMHQYTYYGDGSMHEKKDAAGASTLAHYTYTAAGLMDTATYKDLAVRGSPTPPVGGP